MTKVTLVIIATITILFSAVVIVILLARGYQFDIGKKELFPTGILVATSDPDGAAVLIDGKLKTATNNTISLSPTSYLVKIQKDGFVPWEKKIEIKKEEVFKTNVFLFPAVPDLRPSTLTGAINPALSPDSTKIVFSVASASAEKNGVWVMDMGKIFTPVPIFSGADFRQIYTNNLDLSLSSAKFLWSPDSRQIIASSSSLAVLLETDRINDQPTIVTNRLGTILSQWNDQNNIKIKSDWSKLDPQLKTIFATASSQLYFSPDQSKLLYQATASANLPPILTSYLAGTNPTTQTRLIQPGNTYVYDTKEDRNYLIVNCHPPAGGVNCIWFPSSRHLITYTNQQISIMEYDGTNKALIYAGPFKPGIVYPWPNWSKIVILTSLNNTPDSLENLYTINLR